MYCRPSLHIYLYATSLPGGTGKRRLGVGGHALMSGCPEHWLSNHKLKSALKCTVWSQCTPVPDRQTYGQTDEHHGSSAMIRSTNASRAKKLNLIILSSWFTCIAYAQTLTAVGKIGAPSVLIDRNKALKCVPNPTNPKFLTLYWPYELRTLTVLRRVRSMITQLDPDW